MRSPACLADPHQQRGHLSPGPVSPRISVPGSRPEEARIVASGRPCRQHAVVEPILNYENCRLW